MTRHSETDSDESRLREAVRSFLREASNGYEVVRTRAEALTKIVREETADAVREPLNRHVASLPQGTYTEKKLLANWVNTEMRRMGLALRCPRSGQPSIIQASVGHNPVAGSFRLDYIDDAGKHHNQTVSVQLPELDPMPDTTVHTPHRTRSDRIR